MKNWFKTMLCAVSAATLVACGGGDYVDPNPAAGGGGGGASAAAFAGLTAGMENAAGFAIDGVDAGFYGDFRLFDGTAGLESPAGVAYSAPSCANSASGGEVMYDNEDSIVTYTNCKIGDATLDGKVEIKDSSGDGTATYTIKFDIDPANPLKITGEGSDGKTATFTYSGTQVVTNLKGEYPTYTGAKITLNASVKIGTSSTVKFTNFVVDYNREGDVETTTVDGTYGATLKLADFGFPATPGVPETVDVTLDVSTPTPVQYNYVTDVDTAGVIRFSYAGFFVMEIDYAAKKVRFTPTGAPTQEFPL